MTTKEGTWYLAGPMSRRPQFNIPLFDHVSALLRGDGYRIISPAELDSPEMRRQALASPDGDLAKLERDTKETWGEVLSRDVKIVSDEVTGVIVLPQWETSSGARLEVFIALNHPLKKKDFAIWLSDAEGAVFASRDQMLRKLKENML